MSNNDMIEQVDEVTSGYELLLTRHVPNSEYLKYLFCQMYHNLAFILGKVQQANGETGDISKEQGNQIVKILVSYIVDLFIVNYTEIVLSNFFFYLAKYKRPAKSIIKKKNLIKYNRKVANTKYKSSDRRDSVDRGKSKPVNYVSLLLFTL